MLQEFRILLSCASGTHYDAVIIAVVILPAHNLPIPVSLMHYQSDLTFAFRDVLAD